MRRALALCILAFVCFTGADAQEVAGFGSVTGIVRDSSGEGIPETTVLLSNQALGLRRTMTTTDEGVFDAPALVPAAGYSKTDRKSTRLNSCHRCISYAVFCLKKNWHRARSARSCCAWPRRCGRCCCLVAAQQSRPPTSERCALCAARVADLSQHVFFKELGAHQHHHVLPPRLARI